MVYDEIVTSLGENPFSSLITSGGSMSLGGYIGGNGFKTVVFGTDVAKVTLGFNDGGSVN